jgi:hypothetical protein
MKIPIIFLERENIGADIAIRPAGRHERHLFARSRRLRMNRLVNEEEEPDGISDRDVEEVVCTRN